jgi:tubulin---tyrosine ligase
VILASGTIGATLSSSLSGFPSIALSYGIVEKPIPAGLPERAHELAVKVIDQLWQSGFKDNGPQAPQLYNVNIPVGGIFLFQMETSPLKRAHPG